MIMMNLLDINRATNTILTHFIFSKKILNRKSISQVVLYPQIGLAYNRIRKSANSSVLMYLADELKSLNHPPLHHSESEYDDAEYKIQSMDYCNKLKTLTSIQNIKQVKNYYWFTVVRNPYARVLSAFLDKGLRGKHGNEKYNSVPGFNLQDKHGFGLFIRYLEEGGLFADKHWWPQTSLLYLNPEDFDYIARVENLSTDLANIFANIHLEVKDKSKFSRPHSANFEGNLTTNTSMVTNASKLLDEFYTPDLYHRVYQLYENDFIKLNYARES